VAVVEASRFFEPVNGNVLNDPRVKLFVEDGRTYLKYSEKKYDVIISEPSNPWVAGVANLFTSEYYATVKKRLSPSGVFCQWIQFYELSNDTLNAMLNTMADHFKNISLFFYNGDLICVASDQPLVMQDGRRVPERLSRDDVKKTMEKIQINNGFDLFVGYLASFPEDAAIYASHQRNTDDNLWLEFRAPLEMYRNVVPQIQALPPDVIFDRCCRWFFPGTPRDNVALGLAESIGKLRPGRYSA
jgi:hypothetical protein